MSSPLLLEDGSGLVIEGPDVEPGFDSLDRKLLVTDAVYWAPGVPGGGGETTFAAPIEIRCRWDDVNVVFIGGDGRERTSRSVVSVDQDLKLEGILRKGLLVDLTDPVNPFNNTEVYTILGWLKKGNKKQTKFIRRAML